MTEKQGGSDVRSKNHARDPLGRQCIQPRRTQMFCSPHERRFSCSQVAWLTLLLRHGHASVMPSLSAIGRNEESYRRR